MDGCKLRKDEGPDIFPSADLLPLGTSFERVLYLAGMRILKMCAWEDEFFRRVTRAREDEVRELRCFVYTRAVIIVTWVRVSGGERKERLE